jgi:putative transposase
MPRRLRYSSGGYVYHVLNRAVGRGRLFEKTGDYAAFEKVLRQAKQRLTMRVLTYCLMPNHWHVVVWPHRDGDLSEFFRWLTVTHTQRWHAHHHTSGTGPLYQGRFKSFPIEADEHFLTVSRYVERNALRAGLVLRAEQWRWSSLWHRLHDSGEGLLDGWPLGVPDAWVGHVNRVETEAELAAVRRSLMRGMPFGSEVWTTATAKELGLESSLHPRGRPKKEATTAHRKDSRAL